MASNFSLYLYMCNRYRAATKETNGACIKNDPSKQVREQLEMKVYIATC